VGEQRVRIVGGKWRGRRLEAPRGTGTRPTSDRAREGLFGALEARLGAGLSEVAVLDLFAGTGALGIEALSRGASRAVFIENDAFASAALQANVAALKAGDQATVVRGDALAGASARVVALGPFALLLLDPPYRIEQALVWEAVERLDRDGCLDADPLIVYEHERSAGASAPKGFTALRTYVYGDTAMTLFGRDATDDRGDASL
jgi:16S rRNA (guanine966-N2)-methyltransferase